MPKIKYLTCVYHTILFVCSKRCQIKFNLLFDHKDFVNNYRECTKEPFSFLTINTTLPASDPLRFRKNLLNPLQELN